MPVQLASPSGVAPPGVLPATYRYRTSRLAPWAAPCYAGSFARHDPQEPKWEEAGGRLVQVQLTSPSGVTGTQGTPCDVPISYVGYPRKWVRPRGPRLAMLVSWPRTVPFKSRGEYVEVA